MEGEQYEPTSAGVEGVVDQHHASEGVEPVELPVEATGTAAVAPVSQEETAPIVEATVAEEKTDEPSEVPPEPELAPSNETAEDAPIVTAAAEEKLDERSPDSTETVSPFEQEVAVEAKKQEEEVAGASSEAQAETTDPPTVPEPELVTDGHNTKPVDAAPEEATPSPASATEEAAPNVVSEAAEAVIVKKVRKREDFFLPIDEERDLPRDLVLTSHLLSLDAHKPNNIFYIENDVLITSSGCNVIFLNLTTMTQTFFPSLDGGGIGAIAVHPLRNVFAVAEKCSHRAPNVYLYSYPELTLLKVMEGGTERQYSSLAFNDQGDTLASVGGYPDYLLTLWNWEEEGIVLRAKAFSQDVFTVCFSPYFEGLLNTSGTGHIRFWKAASTFTGLKLQGQLGKFGNVELSDVVAFVEMPDGKVLSGTETGEMLMWDGGLIKVVLTRPMQRPCHEGSIKVLMHDRASNVILSGGDDGFVRLWQFSKINEAEADEDSSGTTITPLDELHIAPGAKIKSLLWERRHWLILDECGALYRVTLPEAGSLSKGAIVTRLMEFHSGGIAACYVSRTSHHALTAGADGTVRVFDYSPQVHQQSCQATLLSTLRFNAPATCAAHLTYVGDGAEAIAVGFSDGVLRLVMRCSEGLALIQAMKPHKGKILSVSINPQGDKLATLGSDDGTVFFFSLSGNSSSSGPNISVNPIGFVTLPSNSTPSCAGWSSDGTSLLIGMALSNVIEVQCPIASTVDTQGSYEIREMIKRQAVFHLPKPPKKSKKEGEIEGEGEREGEGASPDDGGNADGEATVGLDAEETVEEEEEEAKEQVEEQLYEIASISQPPLGSDGDLVITLNGPQGVSDNLWLINLNQEAEAAAKPLGTLCNLPGSITSFVKVHETSNKESFFLTGTRDGMVRVQKASPLSADGGGKGLCVEPGSKAWQARLHDLQHGRITSLEVSFDSSHLISAAMDGSIMVHKLMIEGLSASEISPSAKVVLPSAADVVTALVVDITQSNEYTIEEAKQKAERDALLAEAEAKKMGVREQLKLIRDEFEALLKENEARPEAERIPRSLFEIDPDLRSMIEEETIARETATRLELQWETEKRKLALDKLKHYFLDNIEVERIVLHSIGASRSNQGSYLTTFRTCKLPDEMVKELKEAREAEEMRKDSAARAAEEDSARAQRAGMSVRSTSLVDGDNGGMELIRTKSNAGSVAASTADQSKLSKSDQRRLERKRREQEWEAFEATKPDDRYENPADLAAIEEAKKTVGDFKLKSDPSYVLPEELRATPARKRLQMLELEEAMHGVRMTFNEKFLALREVKKKVISEVNGKLSSIREINHQLSLFPPGQASHLISSQKSVRAKALSRHALSVAYNGIAAGLTADLTMTPEEEPEWREVVSDADLVEFAKKREEEERKAAQGSALGGFAGAAGAKGRTPPPITHVASSPSPHSPTKGPHHPQGHVELDAAPVLTKMISLTPWTDFERAMKSMQFKRLEHHKSKLQEDVAEMVDAFDEALGALKREKLKLEADIKVAEMQQLVNYQELVLLRDFDKKEVVLIQKRQAKDNDRKDLLDKIGECNVKLDQKRIELEGLAAKRALVLADFDTLVPESDAFRDPLSKIFLKRIKRAKKSSNDADDADEDEEEEEDDDDMDDEDEDEQEMCPQGCDKGQYAKVCGLREKRLDEEDRIQEFTKSVETLKKDKENLVKKQKLVEQGLASIQQDITEFQREKQARLNQIDVIVNLRMHQIEYLVDGKLPTDLSQALVFSEAELERLKRRVEELDQEKNDLKQHHKTMKKEHLQLLKDRKAKEDKVKELEAKAHDVQMLKFGQVIDLDLLDKVGAAKGTEELKEQLKSQEQRYALELKEWDARIDARTDELMALTEDNTRCLQAVSDLTTSQRKLESTLAATRSTMFNDPVVQRKQEVEERDALVQLVNAQALELQRLRGQLGTLTRKDASIYQ